MTATALEAHGIVKDFPAGGSMSRVLHGIDLAIEAGRLTMLVGPSGCGKTTLLSIVTGILSPTAGAVDVLGERITALRGKKKALFRRESLGFSCPRSPRRRTPRSRSSLRASRSTPPRAGPRRRSTGSAWPTTPTSCRASSRAGRCSASRSRAHWCTSPP
jgi:energy-coupling factor transporter ATP-binding protein EcfA2